MGAGAAVAVSALAVLDSDVGIGAGLADADGVLAAAGSVLLPTESEPLPPHADRSNVRSPIVAAAAAVRRRIDLVTRR
jgi:hypothetical protein